VAVGAGTTTVAGAVDLGVGIAADVAGAGVGAGAGVDPRAGVDPGAAGDPRAGVDAGAAVEGGDAGAGGRCTATRWGARLGDGAGADGAKSTISSESPTKPISRAAPPNAASVFSDRPDCPRLRG
jgi:hypothetical protein